MVGSQTISVTGTPSHLTHCFHKASFPSSCSVKHLVVKMFNQDHFSSVVQASNCQKWWQQGDAAREPQELLEFVNENGWGSDIKIWAHSTVQ